MKRPTHKELSKKLKQAVDFVKGERVGLIKQVILVEDAIELGYSIEFELFDVLAELIEKTTPDHYTGSKPPQKSYADEISGLELFAFVIEIDRFEEPIYFKFSISQDGLWLVSLHIDREE